MAAEPLAKTEEDVVELPRLLQKGKMGSRRDDHLLVIAERLGQMAGRLLAVGEFVLTDHNQGAHEYPIHWHDHHRPSPTVS